MSEINKVVLGDEVLMDLTSDTVEPDKMLRGITAHGANGAAIIGELDLTDVVELTKAEYDALPDSKLSDGKHYLITDYTEEGSIAEDVEYIYDSGFASKNLLRMEGESDLYRKTLFQSISDGIITVNGSISYANFGLKNNPNIIKKLKPNTKYTVVTEIFSMANIKSFYVNDYHATDYKPQFITNGNEIKSEGVYVDTLTTLEDMSTSVNSLRVLAFTDKANTQTSISFRISVLPYDDKINSSNFIYIPYAKNNVELTQMVDNAIERGYIDVSNIFNKNDYDFIKGYYTDANGWNSTTIYNSKNENTPSGWYTIIVDISKYKIITTSNFPSQGGVASGVFDSNLNPLIKFSSAYNNRTIDMTPYPSAKYLAIGLYYTNADISTAKIDNGTIAKPYTLSNLELQKEIENTISDAYIPGKTYSPGEYCIYGNQLWKCLVSNNTTPVEGSNWHQVNLASELGGVRLGIDANGNYGYYKVGADTLIPFTDNNIVYMFVGNNRYGLYTEEITLKKGKYIVEANATVTSVNAGTGNISGGYGWLIINGAQYGNGMVIELETDTTASVRSGIANWYNKGFVIVRRQ